MAEEIYDAVKKGDVTRFREVLEQDPYLVESVSFECSRNVLHIATLWGRKDIVEEVLKMNPRLARILDSQQSSPLHIAVAEGSLEIVKKLLSVAPEACWWRDCHDMNPIHIAAMNGHVEILEELLKESHIPAMERLHRGQTVFHLCVKHGQLNTLKVLVEKLGEFVVAKDDDGETILHLGVRCKQLEMVQYLVESNKIEKLTPNSMGKTALDIWKECSPPTTTNSEIKRILLSLLIKQRSLESHLKINDITMVVAVLIAAMAFQAAVSPPGGVWQDNTTSHSAGKAVMASTHPKIYKHFVRANSTAFVSSLITILFITTRMPVRALLFLAVAYCAMWVSVASVIVSFSASLIMTYPNQKKPFGHPVAIVVFLFVAILGSVSGYVCMEGLYMSWRRKKQQHEDLTISRFFYLIFQELNVSMSEDRGNRRKLFIRRFLRRLDSSELDARTVQTA